MSRRFAEIILSVCMLLAVELGGFEVEIGTGGYTETPPGWDQELPSGEEAEGDTPGSGGGTRREPVRMDRAGRKPGQPVRIRRSLEQSDRIRRKLEQPVRIRRSLEQSDRIRWKREHSSPAGGRRQRGTTG